MPELPEVENVARSLSQLMPLGVPVKSLRLNRKDLRFPFPSRISSKLSGQCFRAISRRGKFLVFETDKNLLVSHLGMTGSWRELSKQERKVHDHLELEFENGRTFAFHDPRRFGFMSLYEKDEIPHHFKNLGPEPLSDDFNETYLFEVSRKRKVPLKSFLLNQKIVAGLGNIYVCEALFLSKLKPTKLAQKLTPTNCETLTHQIKKVLFEAIQLGGSTIRDYVNAYGATGDFQSRFFVYGRDGEPCRICAQPIRLLKQSGRSTFWCSKCQR